MNVKGKTGVPGAEETELKGAQWQIEREGDEKAMQEQMAQGDKEAEAINASRDKGDPDYDPNNPQEEKAEA